MRCLVILAMLAACGGDARPRDACDRWAAVAVDTIYLRPGAREREVQRLRCERVLDAGVPALDSENAELYGDIQCTPASGDLLEYEKCTADVAIQMYDLADATKALAGLRTRLDDPSFDAMVACSVLRVDLEDGFPRIPYYATASVVTDLTSARDTLCVRDIWIHGAARMPQCTDAAALLGQIPASYQEDPAVAAAWAQLLARCSEDDRQAIAHYRSR